MPTYGWATPTKAFEYYLDRAERTPADLWQATYNGHIRVSIMDVEFSGAQVRALLDLVHENVPPDQKTFELPPWMAVNIDDVERKLCGAKLPNRGRGRPSKTLQQSNEDHRLALMAAKLISSKQAVSLADAASQMIERGQVRGASFEAKMKKMQRVYRQYYRHD